LIIKIYLGGTEKIQFFQKTKLLRSKIGQNMGDYDLGFYRKIPLHANRHPQPKKKSRNVGSISGLVGGR